ncbi:glycosyl hydrolase family 43 protein [Seiridium cupressi]
MHGDQDALCDSIDPAQLSKTMWSLVFSLGAILSQLQGSLALGAHGNNTYQNPIRKPGPDPSIVYAGGYYHLTYTSYDHIEITRAQHLSGLLTGETKVIWTDTNSTRSANMWAPEIHPIDNVWHMFYSSCDANLTCCDSCQPRVLRGCNGPNPFDCEYDFLADLVPPVGFQGGPGKNFSFGIDGTYLDIPGQGRYHVLSAIGPNTTKAIQCIQITELDTSDWTVTGWNVISEPDQPWEMNTTNSAASDIVAVNEGPHPLYHENELWLSYSGSYCGTPNYALGLLHYQGGDPLLASSWSKIGPVFSQANGVYGTGHNCFFKSPDGKETWLIHGAIQNGFHATNNSEGSCGGDRFTLAQIVNFDGGNEPRLGIPFPLNATLRAPSGE